MITLVRKTPGAFPRLGSGTARLIDMANRYYHIPSAPSMDPFATNYFNCGQSASVSFLSSL